MESDFCAVRLMRICVGASDLKKLTFSLKKKKFSICLALVVMGVVVRFFPPSFHRQQDPIVSAEKYGQMHMLSCICKQNFPQETLLYYISILIN